MMAAIRIAVPVADSQLKVNTAGSAVACAPTGGTRCTALSSPGIAHFGAEIASRCAFTDGSPQRKTTTVNTIHGSHGDAPTPRAGAPAGATRCSGEPPRQTRRNAVRQIIELTDATMSTSHGP